MQFDPSALRRLLATIGMLLALPAHADLRISVGVHGDDPAFDWSCLMVARAMERRLGTYLGEPVSIDLRVHANYPVSAAAFDAGEVQAVYLPGLDRLWALHPEVDARMLDAWSTSLATLGLAEVRAIALEAGQSDLLATCRRQLRPLRLAQDIALVPPSSQILYVSALPRYEHLARLQQEMTLAFLNALPATAAGEATPANANAQIDMPGADNRERDSCPPAVASASSHPAVF